MPGNRKTQKAHRENGFTLIELSIVIAIISLLAVIAVPNFIRYVAEARVAQAKAEIRMLEKVIIGYKADEDELPDSLADVGYGGFLDPWGTPYQYLRIEGGGANRGQMRKDRSLVPVNTDFDLYSMGRDKGSTPPFTARNSHDDIVRASDGAYLGFAADY